VLVAAAVCPHPPLLVPEVAAGAAPELAALRAACADAVERIVAARAKLLVLVGAGEPGGERAADAWGTLAPYGVDVPVRLEPRRFGAPPTTPHAKAAAPPVQSPPGSAPGPTTLPLSLTIGAWLLARSSWDGPVVTYVVAGDTSVAACADLGASLARRSSRVGLVAMGDGSARRSADAPGYVDPRASGFDETVATALRDGDPEALLRIPTGAAAELMAGGRAAWQVLAGAARGGAWRAELCYDDAPYGVAYFVASWISRPTVAARPSL